MERVTDEWLKQVALAAYDSSGCESIGDDTKAMIALHRAVSQAVARECVRLVEELRDTPTLGGRPLGTFEAWSVICRIRARFGLEDEARVQQARESQK